MPDSYTVDSGSPFTREGIRLTKVVARSGESIEGLLKRFRKGVVKDRILSEAKKRRYFVSKSEERRIALRKAIRRERKRQWKALRRQRG
jgi:small subunit ribosomal protein S21